MSNAFAGAPSSADFLLTESLIGAIMWVDHAKRQDDIISSSSRLSLRVGAASLDVRRLGRGESRPTGMATQDTHALWAEEFQVSDRDLNRIAGHILRTRRAHDLTALARHIIRARLRSEVDGSGRQRRTPTHDVTVRLWDPAKEWRVRDHVIVAVRVSPSRFEPSVGEVTAVEKDRVHVFLGSTGQPKTYLRAEPGSRVAETWHQLVRDIAEAKAHAQEEREQVDGIILEHGERIVSELLGALRADERFVRLEGRWFLGEMSVLPTEEQVVGLAWRMIGLEQPVPTKGLLPLVKPPLPDGDPGLFGLYLAIRQRPDLIENADAGQHPRWIVAGPPAGGFVAERAAYDPDTYEVLCLPDQPVSENTGRRLLELDLLRAVI